MSLYGLGLTTEEHWTREDAMDEAESAARLAEARADVLETLKIVQLDPIPDFIDLLMATGPEKRLDVAYKLKVDELEAV